MKDNFIFQGKNYISVKRASEISEYAADYIGQLCRASKLDCQRVGRAWFITEESLMNHKSLMLTDSVNRNRIENIRGKKNQKKVSASASVLAPAPASVSSEAVVASSPVTKSVEEPISSTHTNNFEVKPIVIEPTSKMMSVVPIAQVAVTHESRTITPSAAANFDAKEIPAFQWSRTAYVPHDQPAAVLEKISSGQNLNESEVLKLKSFAVSASETKPNLAPETAPVVAAVSSPKESGIKTIYLSDDRPLLPILGKVPQFNKKPLSDSSKSAATVTQNKSLAELVSSLPAKAPAVTLPVKFDLSPKIPAIAAPVLVRTSVAVKSAVSAPAPAVAPAPVLTQKKPLPPVATETKSKTQKSPATVSAAKAPTKTFQRSIPTYSTLARSIILRRALAGTLSLVVLVGFFGISSFVMESGMLRSIGQSNMAVNISNLPQVAAANTHEALVALNHFFESRLSNLVAWFNRPATLTIRTTDETSPVTAPKKDTQGGSMAVFPSSGSEGDDIVMKEKIRNSFSDEVNIYPDQSGTTGVIKPVFKETNGKDFVYVMVPLRDSQQTSIVDATVNN